MNRPARAPTIGRALCAAATRLRGVADDPRREARILLAHLLGVETGTLLGRAREPLATETADRLESLLARRARHVPVAHLTGSREFWSLPFAVSSDTLIPRPDSETLIEAAILLRPDRGTVRRVLDLGTGTGCLLAAALTEFPLAWGLGTDRSGAALVMAAANLRALGLAGRSALARADWAAPLSGRFDLVLCNPPYIPSADLASLAPDVREHEPHGALDGGADGLEAHRVLAAVLAHLIDDQGIAVLEVGQGQADAVGALGSASGLCVRTIVPDLAGVPRAVVLGRPLGSAGTGV